MRPRIAAFFLLVYLFSGTEFAQLLKTPLIWKHFVEHRQECKDLSFWVFLKMHYFNGDPQDADYEQDMQLPFKKPVPPFVAFALPPAPVVFEAVRTPRFYQKIPTPFLSDEDGHAEFSAAIWHPPKA